MYFMNTRNGNYTIEEDIIYGSVMKLTKNKQNKKNARNSQAYDLAF